MDIMEKNAIHLVMKVVILQQQIAEKMMVIAKNVLFLILEKNAKKNRI